MLFIVVDARADKGTEVIFGGAEGAVIRTDDSAQVQTITTDSEVDKSDGLEWPDIDIFGTDSDTDDAESFLYSVINEDNPLSAVFDPYEKGFVEDIPSGYYTYLCKFNINAMPMLTKMIDDARAQGFTVYVNSAYVSYSYQEQIFNGTASGLAESMGLSTDYNDPEYQLAVEKAKTITKYPGTSEHQLGYAVDIIDGWRSGKLTYSSMNQELFAWLDEHCAEYGFIKRYPTKKLLLTGLDESWHYRYVGVEAATFIMENDLCLEEFYAHYDSDFTY